MWICKQIARTDLDIKLRNPRIILTLTHDRNYWTVLYGSAMSQVSLLCSLSPGGDISIVIKPTRCTVSQIFLFWNNTLHVSDGLSVHHQESKTVHTASGICHTGSVAAC